MRTGGVLTFFTQNSVHCRWTCLLLEFLNFFFQMQFFAFQLNNPQVIDASTGILRLNFPLQSPMTLNEFVQMRMH